MPSSSFSRLCKQKALAALLLVVTGISVSRSAAINDLGFPLIETFSAVEVGAEVIGLSATQDSDGVMYFGGNSLLTFDGDRWRNHPVGGSYSLYGLQFGKDGKLWAGALGEVGWFSRTGGTWQYHSLRAQVPAHENELGYVIDVFAYGDGALFAAEDRLLYWNGGTMRSWSLPNTRRVRLLRAGTEIFVQHALTGLYLFRDGELHLVVPASVLGDRSIFWLERRGSDFLMVTNEGIEQITDGELQARPNAASEFIRQHQPRRVLALADGRLAIGTMYNGTAIVTAAGAVEAVFNRASGFDPSNADPLLVDRDGALWVGSRGAIARIALNSASTLFDARASLSAQPVANITRYGGDIVVASPQGLYQLNSGRRTFELIDATFVNDILATGDDLLLGGYRAVRRLREAKTSVVYPTNSDIRTIAISRTPGTFFVGDGNSVGRLSSTDEKRIVVRDLPDTASSIVEDLAGQLWIGTKARGLYVATPADVAVRAMRVASDSGIDNAAGTARVFTLADGTVFAFTPAGAWVRRPGIVTFTPIIGAPAIPAAAVAADPEGSAVWVVHVARSDLFPVVGRISVQTDAVTWKPHAVEGLQTIGVPRAIFAESAGGVTALWLGGTHGLLRHEVRDTIGVPIPRAPLLRATATFDDGRVHAITRDALPASTRSMEFEFAVPEFGRRRTLRLETRIDGVDAGWVPVATGAGRELKLVRAGQYTVRARTIAEAGVASRETVLAFEVLKPWWQTSPAQAGVVLLASLAVFGGYRFRVRRLRRRNAELETKVQQRTEELQRASAAKTEFVANMSHDIRNPLNGIVGLAYALEDTRLDERQRDLVATLRECTSYLSTLVDDVLDFASIEAGRVELRPGPVNASELLGSIATMLKTDTIQSGATLVVECDPALPPHVLGDAGRIQQILVNYVSNALKYAGGTIRLSASLPVDAPEEVEFAVTDFGAGLTAEEQAVLFTKFTRTTQARQHAVPGTGLGLAACRLLADIMGGAVGVISQPGKGATFFLRLPLVVATQRPTEPARALPNATVLLVEDTEYNAAAATAVLQRLGLRCERARTGEEAIRLFGEKRYNIVLLDRNLPDMDGTEVARQMRALEGDGIRSIFLAVTAYCTPEDRTRCIEAGMDAFVGKPLTPDKLRKVLLSAGRPMRGTSTLAMHEPPPVPAAAPVTISGLDTTLLSYLAEGSANGLMEQIARYVANLERTQRELSQLLATRDGEALANTAHRLLGDARLVNAASLAAAVTALEITARNGQLADCPARLELVMTEIARVTEALYRRRAAPTT